jgi:hypothetical protein
VTLETLQGVKLLFCCQDLKAFALSPISLCPVVCMTGKVEAANRDYLDQSYRAIFHVYLRIALSVSFSMSLQHTLETLASLGKTVKLSTLAKMAGFRTAHSPEFRRQLIELKKEKVIEIIQSGWRSEDRRKNHNKVVILKADVWKVHSDPEPKKERESILLKQTENRNEPIQKIILKRRCCKCQELEIFGVVGFCRKYQWEMGMELSEKQTLCYFPN